MKLSLRRELGYALLAIGLISAGCATQTPRKSLFSWKSEPPPAIAQQQPAVPPAPAMAAPAPMQTVGFVQQATGYQPIPTTSPYQSPVPNGADPSFFGYTPANGQGTAYTVANTTAFVEEDKANAEAAAKLDDKAKDGEKSPPALNVADVKENANYAEWMSQYVIEYGDQLEIRFRSTDDLDEVITVRPDGMISLRMVGDIPAAGLTPEQLRQILVTAYSKELKKPEIAVLVRTFSGNNVFVCGEVATPGRIPLSGRITTLKAIILAGGFKDTADREKVIVRRDDGSCCTYDLCSFMECCSNGQDIQLRPYDIVYVPKSRIAKINLFVEQYIDKVLPFSRTFGVFVNSNNGFNAGAVGP